MQVYGREERVPLFDLARAAKPSRAPRRRTKAQVLPSVQWMLDAMTGAAAFLRNGRMDILAVCRVTPASGLM